MSEARATLPTDEARQAATRLARQVEWSEGFWLAYVFTLDANQADFVRARVSEALAGHGRELRFLRPRAPEQLRLEAVLEQPEADCVWVEAIREPEATNGRWREAWMQLILRTNERRELVRGTLGGGLVLVMHPSLKPDVRAAGPDLWSVRAVVFELPAGHEPSAISSTPQDMKPPIREEQVEGRWVDVELFERDLDRWSERAAGAPMADVVESLLELAQRSHGVGRFEQGSSITEQALAVARELVRSEPSAHVELLARALEARAHDLARLGRGQDAVELLEEAVAGRRAIAGRREDLGAKFALANALYLLGVHTDLLGRHDGAEPSLREASDLLRDILANPRSGPLDRLAWPLLASTLTQLGTSLLDRHRFTDALEIVREAVAMARRLAVANPETFSSVLAGNLNNLSSVLGALGRDDEALGAMREAVELARERVSQGATEERSGLAMSLYNLGLALARQGRRLDSVHASAEAVSILDALADEGELKWLAMLATALTGYSGWLRAVGEQDQARDAARRAVTILREQADRGQPHPRGIAAALNNLALVAPPPEARAALQEAADHLRPLATRDQPALRSELAVVLSQLGSALAATGQRREALDVAREAVRLHRQLTQELSEHSRESLAVALVNLGVRLTDCGEDEEAVELYEEAVGLLREAGTEATEGSAPHLASALTNLGARLSVRGDHERAVAVAREAVDVRRHLAEAFPIAERSELAAALVNLGSILVDAGRGDEAQSVTREGLAIYRELISARPGAHEPELAIALHNLARQVGSDERWGEMLELASEAVELRRGLAATSGVSDRRGLAKSLVLLANAHERLGDVESSAEAYAEGLRELGPDVEPDDRLSQLLTEGLARCREAGIEPPEDLAARLKP